MDQGNQYYMWVKYVEIDSPSILIAHCLSSSSLHNRFRWPPCLRLDTLPFSADPFWQMRSVVAKQPVTIRAARWTNQNTTETSKIDNNTFLWHENTMVAFERYSSLGWNNHIFCHYALCPVFLGKNSSRALTLCLSNGTRDNFRFNGCTTLVLNLANPKIPLLCDCALQKLM